MATGPEHYREAEKMLAAAENESSPGWALAAAARAQAHATLALAAATAIAEDGRMPGADYDAWDAVVGVKPEAR